MKPFENNQQNSWETLSETLVLNSSWLKVFKEKCLLPNGKIIPDFYTVWQPDWVLILPFTPEGNWILTRQYRHGTKSLSLEFPAGILNAGESPLLAAQRELEEETAYRGASFFSLGTFFLNPDRHRGIFHAFFAQDVSATGKLSQDETESISTLEMSPEELESAILSGEFFHPHQMAVYFKFKLMKAAGLLDSTIP